MGTAPRSGTSISFASAAPPPSPKIAWRDPSGAEKALMFSITPITFRKLRRAMSATRVATCWAARAGVVTTSNSVLGRRRASAIWMSPVPGGMSMRR